MRLSYEVRQLLKLAISEAVRERLKREPRNLYPAWRNDGLQKGDNRPIFAVAPHLASDAHRNLPPLDHLDERYL